MAFNQPHFQDGKVLRWVHQPLTVDYNGVKISILSSGQVTISKVAGMAADGVVEMDEIQIPAGAIFKAASLLKDTRQAQYLTPEEAAKAGVHED